MIPPTYEAAVTLSKCLTFNEEVEAELVPEKVTKSRRAVSKTTEAVDEEAEPSPLEKEVKDLGEKLRQMQTEAEKAKEAAATKPKQPQKGNGKKSSYRGRGGRGQGGGRGGTRKPLICWKSDFEGHVERFCPFAADARPFRGGSTRDRGYQPPSRPDHRDDYRDHRDSYYRPPAPPPAERDVHAQENSQGPRR